MVDLVDVTCGNCGFEQMLLFGTSNLDQVYNDLNDDFNYYRVFYCPVHQAFTNLETFNQDLSKMQTSNYAHYRCPTEPRCTRVIEVEDLIRFTQDYPCPKCGTNSLNLTTKEMLED